MIVTDEAPTTDTIVPSPMIEASGELYMSNNIIISIYISHELYNPDGFVYDNRIHGTTSDRDNSIGINCSSS